MYTSADICFIFVCRPIKPFFSQVDWLRLTCIVVTAQQRCNYKSANTVISLRQNTTALRRTTDGGSHQRLFLQCKSAVQHTNIHYLPSYLKQTHHVNRLKNKPGKTALRFEIDWTSAKTPHFSKSWIPVKYIESLDSFHNSYCRNDGEPSSQKLPRQRFERQRQRATHRPFYRQSKKEKKKQETMAGLFTFPPLLTIANTQCHWMKGKHLRRFFFPSPSLTTYINKA